MINLLQLEHAAEADDFVQFMADGGGFDKSPLSMDGEDETLLD